MDIYKHTRTHVYICFRDTQLAQDLLHHWRWMAYTDIYVFVYIYICVCVYIYMCVLTAGDCPIGGEGACLWRGPNLQFQECDSAQLATGSAESLAGG